MSAEQLRDRFEALVEQTQAAAGGEFEVRDPTESLVCDLPDGGEGKSYLFHRSGPAPADVDAAVRAVRELWERRGYSVEQSVVGPVVELTARTEDDAPIVFGASEHASDVGGESGCGVPASNDSEGS